ncbi:MAG TPA: MBL fold metallo-hydrolase [Candidatus Limnocylindrales bacterium]|nr:MBL fold metallo-hydrolase [Candidatus Limnocylindrales bacterium]
MRLDVIGAGPAYSDRAGATGACYLLRHAGASLVLDLGQGSFPRLAGLVDPADVEAVAVSHLHPDHYIDVVPLRHYLRYEKPRRRVRVIAPADLEARLDALHDEPGFSAQSLDIEVLEVGTIDVGPFALEARNVTHTRDSYGFRVAPIDGGADAPGLVYSGDCGDATDIDVLVRPGDTLLCEVSFGPGPVVAGAGHLDGPAVGDLARRTGAGRVLLTHLQMGYHRGATVDSVRARFDFGPVELVDPGFETTIGI